MLRSRLLSTFTVIGAILIVLGIVGLILGPRFVYDPGQPVTGKEAWYYLIIGILMVINGLLTPFSPEEKLTPRMGNPAMKTSAISPGTPLSREAAVSAADKSGD